MSSFKKLFSVDAGQIKEDVVITPFLDLEYFARNKGSRMSKGFLFQVLSEKHYSVIKTGVNSAFVGDCVVYLKDSPCRRLYFIGSCGIVSDFNIGDLIVVEKALAWDSFSQILNKETPVKFICAQKGLMQKFLNLNKDVKRANLASLGSLSLQEQLRPLLRKNNVDIVDMEVSSFLSAASYFKLEGLALLYATDIIDNKQFFRVLGEQEKKIIKFSRQRAISLICDFIQNLNV